MAIEKGIFSAPLGMDEELTDMEEMEVPEWRLKLLTQRL